MQRLMLILLHQPWNRYCHGMVLLFFIWCMVEQTLDSTMEQILVWMSLITSQTSLRMITMHQSANLEMWRMQNSTGYRASYCSISSVSSF
uniref:Uncharacterized protein n=1 Tax=Salix viminalis TaxID=40686 RepID=A0A6N2N5G5_SALVM